MKKYLLGLFAILMAIGFSSFSSKKQNTSSASTPLYWYWVSFDGVMPVIEEQDPIDHITKEEADLTTINCEGVNTLCTVGFYTALNFSGGRVENFTPDEDYYVGND
jgi:hypothetical protein